MFRKFLLSLTLGLNVFAVFAQGKVLPERTVTSKFLPPQRVRIYLPPSYETKTNRHFPVLYLHDGQNVFSNGNPNACFGWGDWNLDTIVSGLIRSNQMQEIIMVAIDSGIDRMGKYSPMAGKSTSLYENYADFLKRELKPAIDREFRTMPKANHTAVMGSSLGGICSIALAWNNPEIFGSAASLSGSFQVNHTNFLNEKLVPYRGKAKPIRFYLDSGIIDHTGGDDNGSLTRKAAMELQRIEGTNAVQLFTDDQILTDAELASLDVRKDKWKEAKKGQHNELYWRQRAWRALTFLFPPSN